jgi:hypothetical protein
MGRLSGVYSAFWEGLGWSSQRGLEGQKLVVDILGRVQGWRVSCIHVSCGKSYAHATCKPRGRVNLPLVHIKCKMREQRNDLGRRNGEGESANNITYRLPGIDCRK